MHVYITECGLILRPHVAKLCCLAVATHGFIVRVRHPEDTTPLCSDRALFADVWKAPVITFPLWLLTFCLVQMQFVCFSPNSNQKGQGGREGRGGNRHFVEPYSLTQFGIFFLN